MAYPHDRSRVERPVKDSERFERRKKDESGRERDCMGDPNKHGLTNCGEMHTFALWRASPRESILTRRRALA